MKTEFIKPIFIGERFDEHSIPVEVLKDLAAYEGLVVETAKWLYLQENHNRQRVPRGFTDGFALHLSRIDEGSAAAVLDRTSLHSDLFPNEYGEWFDKARDRIIEVIRVAASGQAFDTLLPKSILSLFDKFGRSLREHEKLEFAFGDSTITYDGKIRKSLVLQTASEYRTEEQLRGAISELDAEKRTLTFKLVNGKKIIGTYAPEVKEQAVTALGAFGEALVLADCVVVRDQKDLIRSIENVSRIEPLDPLDVPARLEALFLLTDGWLDGEGIAPKKNEMDWFSHAWLMYWPSSDALPHVYPTLEGGVQAEWSFEKCIVDFELNLSTKYGSGTCISSDGRVLFVFEVSLDTPDGWKTLSTRVSEAGKM